MSNFVLDQTTTVHFSVDQLMAIAVNVLQEEGHDFSDDTIKPTLNNKGLTLVIGKEVGKPVPKKRKTRKVAEPKETETTTEPEESVVEAKKEPTRNPFAPTSPDAAVAKIREENGVSPVANFPSDAEPTEGTGTAISFYDIANSDEG